MKDPIYIKSFPNGLKLHLVEEMSFEEILQVIAEKFEETRKFFGNASLALAIEGRSLTDSEEVQILDTISKHSDVRIICVVNKDEAANAKFAKEMTPIERKLCGDDDGHFLKGSLKNKEVLETDTSIVIIGDVEAGCAVISSKNIIVIGALYGEAYAGGNGQPGAFIAALEMAPERLKIGDVKYKTGEKRSLFGSKNKNKSQVAFVKDGKIVFDNITKDLLSSF
ncbi:MAG: septum site-determining protein MinC [Acetatifactor sp.]|nr:septum site-determining protein MinC [Acetatifactor sp.]